MAIQTAQIDILINGAKSVDQITAALQQLKADVGRLNEAFENGEVSSQEYADGIDLLNGAIEQLSTSYNGIIARNKQINQELAQLNEQFKSGQINVTDYNTKFKQLNQELANNQTALKNSAGQTNQFGQALLETTGSLGQFGTGFQLLDKAIKATGIGALILVLVQLGQLIFGAIKDFAVFEGVINRVKDVVSGLRAGFEAFTETFFDIFDQPIGDLITKALLLPFTPVIIVINQIIEGLNLLGANLKTIPTFADDATKSLVKAGQAFDIRRRAEEYVRDSTKIRQANKLTISQLEDQLTLEQRIANDQNRSFSQRLAAQDKIIQLQQQQSALAIENARRELTEARRLAEGTKQSTEQIIKLKELENNLTRLQTAELIKQQDVEAQRNQLLKEQADRLNQLAIDQKRLQASLASESARTLNQLSQDQSRLLAERLQALEAANSQQLKALQLNAEAEILAARGNAQQIGLIRQKLANDIIELEANKFEQIKAINSQELALQQRLGQLSLQAAQQAAQNEQLSLNERIAARQRQAELEIQLERDRAAADIQAARGNARLQEIIQLESTQRLNQIEQQRFDFINQLRQQDLIRRQQQDQAIIAAQTDTNNKLLQFEIERLTKELNLIEGNSQLKISKFADLEQKRLAQLQASLDQQEAELAQLLADDLIAYEDYLRQKNLLDQQRTQAIIDSQQAIADFNRRLEQEDLKARQAYFKTVQDLSSELVNNTVELADTLFKNAITNITGQLDLISQQLQASQAQAQTAQQALQQTEDQLKKATGDQLAGLAEVRRIQADNTAKEQANIKKLEDQRRQLEQKKYEQELAAFNFRKAVQVAEIAAGVAIGVAKATANYLGNPLTAPALGLILPLIIGAGAVQTATVLAQKAPAPPQFQTGGFTPQGGDNQVVGVVHANEYVVPAKIVRNPVYKNDIARLERARLRGYQTGGLVSPTNKTTPAGPMPEIIVSVREIADVSAKVALAEARSSL
jgi:hypothetical protein